MSSRLDPISAPASSSLATRSTPLSSAHTSSHSHSHSQSKAWVEPSSLPDYGVDPSSISGNVTDYVKQLNSNTYLSYGVGDEDCFGHRVGTAVKFVQVNVDRRIERQDRLESTTVAELIVTKSEFIAALHSDNETLATADMLNGAGMLHGGCVAYLIDK
jgi:acyl-coenzyme A thioesterase 13